MKVNDTQKKVNNLFNKAIELYENSNFDRAEKKYKEAFHYRTLFNEMDLQTPKH